MRNDFVKQFSQQAPRFTSLRARLLLLLFLTFLPVYSFIFYTVFEARQQAADNARRDALALTRLVALKQKNLIEFSRQQLLNLAQLPIVRRPELATPCNLAFADLLKQNPLYSNFGVIDPDGMLRCSAVPMRKRTNLSDRRYFSEAMSTRGFVIGDYQIGRVTSQGSANLAYPVQDATGKPLAVVYIALDLGALTSRLIETSNLPPGSTLSILDNHGTILARHPDPGEWVGKTLPNAPLIRTLLAQGKEGTAEETGVDGVKRLYVFKPFYSTATKQIYVSAGIPTDTVYADTNALLSRALLLMTLVTAAVIVLARMGSSVLVLRPVNALMNAARHFGLGNLGVRTGLPHTSDEFGQMARVFDEMAQSIEERERRQRASEARFTNIVNLAADAIISVDEEQRIVAYNHAAAQIFGRAPADMLGQPLDLLLPTGIAALHREHISAFGRESGLTRVVSGGRAVAGRRADGSVFPAEASISKFIDDGHTVYTVVLRDITERNRAEQALQQKDELLTMVGAMAKVGGWEFDARTLKATWTDEVARIHDTDPNDPTAVETGINYYSEGSRKIIEAAVKDAIEHAKPYDLKLEITTAKGKHKWVRTIGQPVMEDGAIVKVWGSFQDITEQKRAEEEIRQLNSNLERRILDRTSELAAANKELEAFSYSVSHDLRAPLRAIDGFSQALLEDYAVRLDEQGRDYLSRVRGATQHMGQLIDDMLTLSRVTRVEMLRENVDLSALTADVLAELQQGEPGRKVDWHIEPGLIASCDQRLLRVVLVNLLGNAWKFIGKTANATIDFDAIYNADGTTDFFVRDNGSGFDMLYADKLFGVFQRLHTAAEFPGTGVGLATVQRIIHRHGGQVRGIGTLDQGATFYFSLPG